jgi:hypothetical protein
MYLFFVRAFNDIDHITPIVWKMSRDHFPVRVYCLNPEYDIRNDYRLNYLRESGVKVEYIYDAVQLRLSLLQRITRFIALKAFAVSKHWDKIALTGYSSISRKLSDAARKIGRFFYHLEKRKYYNHSWARNFLVQSEAKILCFDWIRPKQFVVDTLLRAAKDMLIPTLALPHGVLVYTNEVITVESSPQEKFDKLNSYNAIIVQNKLYWQRMVNSGIDEQKITILGSARYCQEWMAQNKKILPRVIQSDRSNSNKLKIVFMTTRTRYRVDAERMFETFKLLSEMSGVEVWIKPHTRTAKEARLFQNLSLPEATDISSVELCEWADVVIVVGSSIILEPLLQGKPALYLKYLHGNITLYEEHGACWIIHDEAELQSALSSLQKSPEIVPYSDKNTKKFISEIIYGGRGDRDVLEDYRKFIISLGTEV